MLGLNYFLIGLFGRRKERSFLISALKIFTFFYAASSYSADKYYLDGHRNLGLFRTFAEACAASLPIAQRVFNTTPNSRQLFVEFFASGALVHSNNKATCVYNSRRSDGYSDGGSAAYCDHSFTKFCEVLKDECDENLFSCDCLAGENKNDLGICVTDTREKGPALQSGCMDNNASSSFVGNPISIGDGNKFQSELDYFNGISPGITFSRSYNSIDGLWRHNFSAHLRVYQNKIIVVTENGRESLFVISGESITGLPVERGALVKKGSGWVYTTEDNQTYTFEKYGRLIKWNRAPGIEYTIVHSALLGFTVTDSLGQSIYITEDYLHQPLSLRATGLTIQYEYNANQRLSQLTRTRGGQAEQRRFHYEIPNKPNLLTGITDERGVRFATWTYDDRGRASSSEHAGGVERTYVTYNTDGSRTVTNELGKKTIYSFVSIDGIKRTSTIEGEPSADCPMSNSTFTYDARGLLKTKTDNKGHLTTYDYNDRGLEVSRTEAAGTPQARTVTTDWHPTLFLPVTVTEPSRITHYTYDDQGRQLSQSVTQR